MSKDILTKHVAHVLGAILLSMTIKYQVNILYIFCLFLYKSVIASHSVQFLPFRKEDCF